MNKAQVRDVLRQMHEQQLHANLGGIVGGEEGHEAAENDLQELTDALNWFDKNVMNKKNIK